MKGENAYYYSLSRDERHASLHVNVRRNVWYDFGENVGGGVIDLVCHTLTGTIPEALAFLESSQGYISSFQKHYGNDPSDGKGIADQSFINISVTDITMPDLLEYISVRQIPPDLLREYCREVSYGLRGRSNRYRAIGFPNRSGGYELRNACFKGCLGRKDISLIGSDDASVIRVFEGFMDFLSYMVMAEGIHQGLSIVLNSVVNVSKACECIGDSSSRIECYMDNDAAGRGATELLLSHRTDAVDMSSQYVGFNDLNDFLVSIRTGK